MSISGVVVHVQPSSVDAMIERVTALEGVEVHAATEDGRLVMTVDRPNDGDAAEAFGELQGMDGVLSISLVYNYFDQHPAEEDAPR
jgi:nitrate reductase NapD